MRAAFSDRQIAAAEVDHVARVTVWELLDAELLALQLEGKRGPGDCDRELAGREHRFHLGVGPLQHPRIDVLATEALVLVDPVHRRGLVDRRPGSVVAQQRAARLPDPGREARDDARVVLAGDAEWRDLARRSDCFERVVERLPIFEPIGRVDTNLLEDVGAVVDGARVDEPGDRRDLAGVERGGGRPCGGDEGGASAEVLDFVRRELADRACRGESSDPTHVDLHDVWSAGTGARQRGAHLGVGVARRDLRAFHLDVRVLRVEGFRGVLEVLVGLRAAGHVPEVDRRRCRVGGRRAAAGGSQDQPSQDQRGSARGKPPHVSTSLTAILPVTCAVRAGLRGSVARRGGPPARWAVGVGRSRIDTPTRRQQYKQDDHQDDH